MTFLAMIRPSTLREIIVGVLDEEGYTICPDCLTRIHCGPVGLANLEKRHRGYKICKEMKAKRDKEAKRKKDGSLLSFFGKNQKPTAIASIVKPSAPVRGQNLSTLAGPAVLVASPPKETINQLEPLEPVHVGDSEPPINDSVRTVPRNCVCEACKVSGEGRGNKRARR